MTTLKRRVNEFGFGSVFTDDGSLTARIISTDPKMRAAENKRRREALKRDVAKAKARKNGQK